MSRLVFVTSTSGWGGSEELWARTAALLAKNGHSVTAFLGGVGSEHPRVAELVAAGCHVRDMRKLCLPPRISPGNSLRAVTTSLGRLIGRAAAQRAIRPILRAHIATFKPDLVVICQGCNFDGLAYMDLCRCSGRPYVIISQKATDSRWPPDNDRLVMRSAFRGALRCYFVSQHNLELTQWQIGDTLTHAEIVRNPFLVSGQQLSWPEGGDSRLRLACVARLDVCDKGQDILLHVLARQQWRDRHLLVSYYGVGSQGEALRALAERLALRNVRFCGFVSDVESIWRSHHALVLPSRTEGLPLALVEAMMCGRFGIITDEGGGSEVVEEGGTGFIAKAATVDEFDKAMERAWQAREQWPSLGRAAAASIRTMVPPDPAASFAAKLLEIMDSLKLRSRSAAHEYAYAHEQSD